MEILSVYHGDGARIVYAFSPWRTAVITDYRTLCNVSVCSHLSSIDFGYDGHMIKAHFRKCIPSTTACTWHIHLLFSLTPRQNEISPGRPTYRNFLTNAQINFKLEKAWTINTFNILCICAHVLLKNFLCRS